MRSLQKFINKYADKEKTKKDYLGYNVYIDRNRIYVKQQEVSYLRGFINRDWSLPLYYKKEILKFLCTDLSFWREIKNEKEIIKLLISIENATKENYKKEIEYKTYIMKDKQTGLYKIGKSKNPKIREKTLQSEKPTIELIKVFNKDIEQDLHKKYKNQRIRGEWFSQLKYICNPLAY